MGMKANRLVREKSPYLLQHAYNPVDWYPWGEEAFQQARRQDKPIFLSVGYASCHWCHVMEKESFQDPQIAALLNRHFVPVKVDREERPDVDRLYMAFVQASTGSGGWPMSVFLTPAGEPFFGGTYFPPDNRYGRPGFRNLLERIAQAWLFDREQIRAAGGAALERLRRQGEAEAGHFEPGEAVLGYGFNAFRRSFDPVHGGFGGAPKFPRPSVLSFLLRYYERSGNQEALEMALATLQAMARGGLRDHLGGGFHRYAVDEAWRVPHFEKMLYDQAQLALAYLEAWQITGRPWCAEVARQTLDYVLREMTHPEGGFHSAEDADSALGDAPETSREGGYYLWTAAQIRAALGPEAAAWFCAHYGVQPEGEWVLHEAQPLETTAELAGLQPEPMRQALAEARRLLLAEREKRPRPARDDKILTAWNGLMISALARASRALEEPRYREAAERAAEFLAARLYEGETLLRRYRDGEAGVPGFLEDYAFLAQGLLDLYEAGFRAAHLERALQLTEQQIRLFEDPQQGGFYSARPDCNLPFRLKEDYDGAEPAGNSVAALNLLRLAAITGRDDLGRRAERTLAAFGRQMTMAPDSLPWMLVAAAYSRSGLRQIVLAGEPDARGRQPLLNEINRRFLPDRVLLAAEPATARLAPWLAVYQDSSPAGAEAAVCLCEGFACQLPVKDPAELAERLTRPPGA
jgi:uncharacterized protein YyaL (SSP411 family)